MTAAYLSFDQFPPATHASSRVVLLPLGASDQSPVSERLAAFDTTVAVSAPGQPSISGHGSAHATDLALSRLESLADMPDPLGECEPIGAETVSLCRLLIVRVARLAEYAGFDTRAPDVSADLDGRIFLTWRSAGPDAVTAIVSRQGDGVAVVQSGGGSAPVRNVYEPDRAVSGVFSAIARMSAGR